jgi:hypothetical protein
MTVITQWVASTIAAGRGKTDFSSDFVSSAVLIVALDIASSQRIRNHQGEVKAIVSVAAESPVHRNKS